MTQEFRIKNTDEARNYFLEEIKQNEKYAKLYRTLSYFSFYNF